MPMELLYFFRGILPTQTEREVGLIFSGIGTVFSYLCGWGAGVEALLTLMVVDYVSGVLATYINPCLSLNSQKGFRGICKKILILLLVVVAHMIDKVLVDGAVQVVIVWFFIGNEGLSIVENAANAGLPVPERLRATLEQLKHEKGDTES